MAGIFPSPALAACANGNKYFRVHGGGCVAVGPCDPSWLLVFDVLDDCSLTIETDAEQCPLVIQFVRKDHADARLRDACSIFDRERDAEPFTFQGVVTLGAEEGSGALAVLDGGHHVELLAELGKKL